MNQNLLAERHSRYTQRFDIDTHDDDVTIGNIIKRSATARRSGEKMIGLTRSTSHANVQRNSLPEPVENSQDPELQLDIQIALALLESNEKPEQVEQEENIPEIPVSEMNSNTGRIQTVKALTTRIYIEDANTHKLVQLTNLLTAAMVIQSLKKKGALDNSDDWTLFEHAKSHNVQRPLREWEIVLDIISLWNAEGNNALLLKKYPYHYTLTSETVFQKTVLPMHGWLTIEYKKGKWQKKYCFIKDNAIHHAKDKGATSSSILCHLASYDVYTLIDPLNASPTEFVFAIRAQVKPTNFGKEGDYIRFMTTEDQEEMKNWVLSIRQSKSTLQYQCYPNRVVNPLAPILLEKKSPIEESTMRRQKTLPSISRSESTRKLDRSKSKRKEDSPLIDCSDTLPFVKGSLLAKEDDPEPKLEETNTLIHIDEKIKFSKGSLLAKKEIPDKMRRSKSVREIIDHGEKKHTSLRRKPTSKKQSESSVTLLKLDDSPERFHSRELHGRHVKPLINFDTRK